MIKQVDVNRENDLESSLTVSNPLSNFLYTSFEGEKCKYLWHLKELLSKVEGAWDQGQFIFDECERQFSLSSAIEVRDAAFMCKERKDSEMKGVCVCVGGYIEVRRVPGTETLNIHRDYHADFFFLEKKTFLANSVICLCFFITFLSFTLKLLLHIILSTKLIF